MQTPARTSSRIHALVVLCFAFMAIFVIRLFVMQVINHDSYVAQAEAEQIKTLTIKAKRGEIYALDHGKPVKLVLNQSVYTVFADPKQVDDPDGIVNAVEKITGKNAQPNLKKLVAADNQYQVLAKNVSRTQAQKLKAKGFSGLGFQEGVKRMYPEGKLAAQVLGFVNNNGNGQYGVEQSLNGELTGKDGTLKSVTDVSNVPLTIGDKNVRKPAQDGKNIALTIDRNIQSYTEQALKKQLDKLDAKRGSVIVMDPQNGHVLSMANYPTYSPAKYYDVQDALAFDNGTITTPYEPGSVMKTFTAAIGIDKGAIEPDSTYNNTDYIKIDDTTITNASKGQTGNITFQHAMNWSLNTGYVTVAERLGDGKNITRGARDTMYDYLHNRFQLGQKTGIPLSGEASGDIISPKEVQGNAVRYSNMAFGQGMDLTMLQVASGFSAIVNGGMYYTPTIIDGEVTDSGLKTYQYKKGTRILSEDAAMKTRKMVHGARSAFYAGTDKKGYYIGGKTGTSQNIVNGKYTFDETTASYLGFGGNKTSRYVIMVQVSSPGKNLEGDTGAMPVFNDISNWMLGYQKVHPL